ncbi:MAG: hypothetical protein WD490_04990 [Opitutales bacterium]
MPPIKHTLLYLSLVLNGLLVVAMLYRGTFAPTFSLEPEKPGESGGSDPELVSNLEDPATPTLERPSSSEEGASAPGSVDTPPDESPVGTSPDESPAGTFQWEEIHADDPREFIANLKALGIPDQTIAMIVMADVQRGNAGMLQQAFGENAGAYWRQPDYSFAMDPELQINLMKLQRDTDQLLREELGDDYMSVMGDAGAWTQRQYGFLSADKRQEIMTLDQDFSVLQQYVHQRAQGYMLPEDQEELQQLEAEKRAELESLLTPEELFEYDLRNSNLSNQLRFQLRFTDVSEEEFRQIYALRQQYEGGAVSPFAPPQPVSPGLQGEINEQLREVLGEERFREYELSQDHEYQQLVQLTNRLDLPRERALEMVELKEVVEQVQREIQSDSTLSSEERSEALRLLAEEVRAESIAALGESGFDAYRERGGWWIQNLEQVRNFAPVPVPVGE